MKRGFFRIYPVFFYFIFYILFFPASYAESPQYSAALPARMNLLVVDILPVYPPYDDFCRRNPKECDMTGPEVIELSPESRQAIIEINRLVNKDINFALDIEQYNKEEYWNYPKSGWGDCEDKALEKRYRLVEKGVSRSTLRLAIVFHKKSLHSHSLLTFETSEGTYILDSFVNDVRIWHQTPYNFEIRERSDGSWERFDQGVWSYQ